MAQGKIQEKEALEKEEEKTIHP